MRSKVKKFESDFGELGAELQGQGSVQRGAGAGVLYRNPSLRTDIMTDTHD